MDMKNIYIILIAVCTVFVACKDDEGPSYYSDLEAGWVQFPSNNTSSIINLGTGVAEVEIPLFLQTTTNIAGLDVTYELVSVSGGSPSAALSGSNVVSFAAGTDNGSVFLSVDNTAVLTEPLVVDVILTGTSRNNVRVGLSDGSKPVAHRITVNCASNVGTSYAGDAASSDLGLGFGIAPAWTPTLAPVAGVDNQWTVDSAWGPDFVNFLCGGCVPPGSFPYPATITLNSDNSVTVTGDGYATGGSGTYDPCSDEFDLVLTQALFSGSFTVEVKYTSN